MILLTPANEDEKKDLLNIANKLNLEFYLVDIKGTRNSILSKAIQVLEIISLTYKLKPKIILGAPSFKNRIVSLISNTKYFAYLRGLHASSNHASSRSDKIFFLAKSIGLNPNNKLLNSYQADHCFVSSIITKEFLNKRGIPNHKISIVGPIWLENSQPIEKSISSKRIFFLTQSYKEHKLQEAANNQVTIIQKIQNYCEKNGIDFMLKKHPRDYSDYHNIRIFEGDAEKFIKQINSQDLIISSFSTLAFEIQYLGGNVRFITFRGIDNSFSKAFRQFGIDFTDLSKFEINGDLFNKSSLENQIFKEIDFNTIDGFINE